jgi:hypothetical protein
MIGGSNPSSSLCAMTAAWIASMGETAADGMPPNAAASSRLSASRSA